MRSSLTLSYPHLSQKYRTLAGPPSKEGATDLIAIGRSSHFGQSTIGGSIRLDDELGCCSMTTPCLLAGAHACLSSHRYYQPKCRAVMVLTLRPIPTTSESFVPNVGIRTLYLGHEPLNTDSTHFRALPQVGSGPVQPHCPSVPAGVGPRSKPGWWRVAARIMRPRRTALGVYSLFSGAECKTRTVSWSIICSSGTRLSRQHHSQVTGHVEWRALSTACLSMVPPREIAEQFGHRKTSSVISKKSHKTAV